jgi:hypothetical protein
MARMLLAGVVLAAAVGAVGPAAADQMPLLRSARAANHHLVLRISVSDLRPTEMLVAKRRAVNVDGALLPKNVRMRETIQIPASASGVVRWQSARRLRAGTYFVQVQAVQTGEVLDCPPKIRDCNDRWSNVRRVVVRRSS